MQNSFAVALRNIAEQLSLEDKLALFVFLRVFICLVVLPTHSLLALAAGNVADDVSSRCHISLARFAGVDVDNAVEEIGLAMLATEILCKMKEYVSCKGIEVTGIAAPSNV